jgi:hypothetical protein
VRRLLAWLVVIPLSLGGAQLAHAFDYWLVAPSAHERSELLAGSGHAYFAYLPFAVALLGAMLVAALVAVGWQSGRGRRVIATDGRLLATLPLATFALQEYLERHLHDGAFPWLAFAEPTFVVGLVLQLPFALAAYAVARVLVRAAEAIGAALVRRRAARPTSTVAMLAPVSALLWPRSPLAGGRPSRGPPLLSPA